MSQSELGIVIGFTSRVQIGRYERGEADISKTTQLSVRYLLRKQAI